MLQVKYSNINIEFIHESFQAKVSSNGIVVGPEERERERSFSILSSLAGAETFLGLNLYSDGDGEQNCRAKQPQLSPAQATAEAVRVTRCCQHAHYFPLPLPPTSLLPPPQPHPLDLLSGIHSIC